MTAPWLRRRSKTEELEGIAALIAIALHFVVATAAAFVLYYSGWWLHHCSRIGCGMVDMKVVIYGFIIFDILLFLAAWGLSVVLSSKGWWRVVPPLVGTVITMITGLIALYLVLVGAP